MFILQVMLRVGVGVRSLFLGTIQYRHIVDAGLILPTKQSVVAGNRMPYLSDTNVC
jgi:hypothetical protein